MTIKLYQVDAFTREIFGGNPAEVCPLDSWLEDNILQKIVNENNLSETVFFVQKGNKFQICWFTPTSEVDLCGHATLASAYVLFNILKLNSDTMEFESKSERVIISRNAVLYISGENYTTKTPFSFPFTWLILATIPFLV